MSQLSAFRVSTTLVVLSGIGSEMGVLLPDGQAQDFRLPERPIQPGVHPLIQARSWLDDLGLNPKGAQYHLLNLKGFQGSDAALKQGILIWLPDSKESPKDSSWRRLGDIPRFADRHGSFVCEALAFFWSFMPTAKPSLAVFPPFGSLPDHNQPVIFFGGSFNPWHRAHLACIELCLTPQRVVVVPDYNPRKALRQQDCAWKAYRQLVKKVAPTGAHVFPGFCGLEYPNPTVTWLPYTQLNQRQMLLGDDSLVTLPGWVRAKVLVQALDHLWVAPRQSANEDIDQAMGWLDEWAPDCQIQFLDDHPYRHISSTQIRAGRKNQT